MARFSPFREPWPRIIGIPVLALVLSFLFHTGLPSPLRFSITLGITAIIWQGCFMIISLYRRRFPGISRTGRRIMITALALSTYIILVDVTACTTLDALGLEPSAYTTGEWRMNLVKCFGATLVVGTIYEAGYFFHMWKHQAIETEALRSRQLRAELDILRSQVSPHFLFNSLNTLVYLIPEEPEKAVRFVQQLSKVYRYVLESRDARIIPLQEELDFLHSYVFLLKERFGENLRVHLRGLNGHSDGGIVPLTLQMLFENAIKHNVLSTEKPLIIEVFAENGRLVVRNNLQKKNQVLDSTGVGLENIRARYRMLTDREVETIVSREYFTVLLPMVEREKVPETEN